MTRAQQTVQEGSGSEGVSIRMAALKDAGLVAQTLREAFAEYRDSYTPEAFAATTPTSAFVRRRMKEGPVWIAALDSSVVGTASAVGRGADLYVRGMAVLPVGRGRGIGRLLLQQAEDYARAYGYGRLVLSTTPFLHRAIRLYENFGFRRSEEGPDNLLGTPLFTMVKNLREPLKEL